MKERPPRLTKGQRRGMGLRVKRGLDELGDLDAPTSTAVCAPIRMPKAQRRDPSSPARQPSATFPEVAVLEPVVPGANESTGVVGGGMAIGRGGAGDEGALHVFASWDEWASVKQSLFDVDSYKRVGEALRLIDSWILRARGNSKALGVSAAASASRRWRGREEPGTRVVPLYVLATRPLVEAAWLDRGARDSAHAEISEEVVKLQYGAAISRSVHLLTGELQAGTVEAEGDTYRSRARAIGLPEEAVEVRLRVAHQAIPPLTELRMVAQQLIAYLHQHFWVPQEKVVGELRRQGAAAAALAAARAREGERLHLEARKRAIAGCATTNSVAALLADASQGDPSSDTEEIPLEELERLAKV